MPGSVQSIERAAAVLRLLAQRSTPLGLADIASALGLAKTTAHGILRTLCQVDFVERESDGYRLGPTLLHLGAGRLDVNELRSQAMNWADTLAARSAEAVHIAAPVQGGVLIVHHVFRPDNTEQSLKIGTVLPAHATAVGKVLLAHDESMASAARRGELTPFTRRTVRTVAQLDRALAETREAGWAGEVDEFRPGEAAIAAVLRSPGGLVAGAIAVAGPIGRLCGPRSGPRARLVREVRDTAAAITRELHAGP